MVTAERQGRLPRERETTSCVCWVRRWLTIRVVVATGVRGSAWFRTTGRGVAITIPSCPASEQPNGP